MTRENVTTSIKAAMESGFPSRKAFAGSTGEVSVPTGKTMSFSLSVFYKKKNYFEEKTVTFLRVKESGD